MKLDVEWEGATRPVEQKRLVEITYRDSILGFFNGVEAAYKAKNTPSPHNGPYCDWQRANRQAMESIRYLVSPTEFERMQPKVIFT